MRQQQAIGALIICMIIAVIVASLELIPRYFDHHSHFRSSAALDSLYADSLQRQWDSIHPAYTKSQKRKQRYVKPAPIPLCLQPFDPNTADSLTLLQLGFQPWQVRSLIRYRAKGARFRKPSDLRKLYGMTDSMFLALQPWIQIDSIALAHLDSLYRSGSLRRSDSLRRAGSLRHSDSLYRSRSLSHSDSLFLSDSLFTKPLFPVTHEKRDTILELNLADTSSLQFIRGIGPTRAKQIVRYREQLGGFASINQLAEIQGLPFDSISPHFTVDTSLIRPLQLNFSSLRALNRHPYIRYEQARQIEDLRHRRTIRSEADLLQRGIFSATELLRLRPYLRYDKE